MSRNLPAAFLTALTSKSVQPALFFEAEFADGWLRLWSGLGDIETFKTWRTPGTVRNRVTNSEPTLAQLSTGSGITAGTVFGGFLNVIQFGNAAVSRWAYVAPTGIAAGASVTLSVYVIMDDGLAPVVGLQNASADFCLVIGGNLVPQSGTTIENIGGGIFRISGTLTVATANHPHNGIVKYSFNSARPFRASGYDVEVGPRTGYQRVVAGVVTEQIGNVYTGAGLLLGFSEIEESRDVVASGMSVSLSAIPAGAMARAISLAQQGAPGRIYLGLMQIASSGVTLVADPVILMAGILNFPRVQGGAVINLTYENRLADLTRSRELRYTDEAQQLLYPGDRGFEYTTSIQQKAVWGGGS